MQLVMSEKIGQAQVYQLSFKQYGAAFPRCSNLECINMINPDFINISTSGSEISRQFLADNIEEGGAHIDAIQLIPHDGYIKSVNRPWYAAAEICDVNITDCSITSLGSLQGITGFDGLFRNISVNRCVFYLSSPHKVTFNGLLSGSFYNLYSGEFQNSAQSTAPLHGDTKCLVRLNNLRIGGAINYDNKIHHTYIIGFSDSKNTYKPVDFDITASIVDTRGIPVRSSARAISDSGIVPQVIHNIDNFDLDLFRRLVSDVQPKIQKIPVQDVCYTYQRLALRCGDLIK